MSRKQHMSESASDATASAAPGTGGRRSLFFGTTIVAAALAAWLFSTPLENESGNARNREPLFTDFVGSEACAGCHAEEYAVWRRSTHGQAGGKPSDVNIIARFDGKPLHFSDATVTPLVRSTGEHVFRVEFDGQPMTEIEADYVVGGGHMHGGGTQSFFGEFPDGSLRFLPFDFIRQENLWFVQRKDGAWVPISEKLSLRSGLINWPPHRVLGATGKFSNCQDCHGSQISIVEGDKPGTIKTRFTTLAINCESCHGAGRRHIEIVSEPGFEGVEDLGMVPLETLSKDASLMVCFRCHAGKDALHNDRYFPGPGASLDDYMSLKTPLLDGTQFFSDGRIQKFGYQTNHLYSDCYLNGSMTCVDCHDPHSQGYRDVFFKPLRGKFDDGQCTGCHAAKVANIEAHTHHPSDSRGSRCTSCHMPFLQHQGLGSELRFARSDHTIPIPRPAFDTALGVENACGQCHEGKPTAWLQEKVESWYGVVKPHVEAVADLFAADKSISDRGSIDLGAAKRLLLHPDAKHPLAQMDGLSTYLRHAIRPDERTLDPEVFEKLKVFSRSDDVDHKALALLALHFGYRNHEAAHRFLQTQIANLGEKRTAVMTRWGIAADRLAGGFADRKDLHSARKWMESAEEALPENTSIKSHLALTLILLGEGDKAIQVQQKAIEIAPEDVALRLQLAQFYMKLQRIKEAIEVLEEGLRHSPDESEEADSRTMLRNLKAQQNYR